MRKYKIKRVIRRSTSMYGISPAEVALFLKQEYVLHVHSTNVLSAQYIPLENKLIITFKNGSAYAYKNVGKSMVDEFVAASSKGKYVHSTFVASHWPFDKIN